MNSTFFRVKFVKWSAFSPLPYCKIVEELGPLHDAHNFGKVIMRQNGVSFDKFPDKAV
jgi:hypothetical protein